MGLHRAGTRAAVALTLAVLTRVFVADSAVAQVPPPPPVAWDAPMLIGPSAGSGFGIHLTRPSLRDEGVLLTWRADGPGLGVRLGTVANGWQNDFILQAGVDLSGSLLRSPGGLPIEAIWFLGTGFGIPTADDGTTLVSFPLGISVGALIPAFGIELSPYVAPRVSFDATIGGREWSPNAFTDTVGLATDLGLDIALHPNFMIRIARTVGEDRDLLSLGIAVDP
jgi:hypothetical protein